MESPYNIYTKLLFSKGLGHALWIPEPGSDGEILIGDVGFIDQGRFFRMFNIFWSARDPPNANGVPEHFQILNLPLNQIVEREVHVDHPICSDTVRCIQKGVDDVFELECTDDQGAFLLLKDSPTQARLLLSKSVIKDYMLPNCEEWASFAQSGLRPDDIRLVSGWVKTDEWFLGAIAQNGRSARMQIDANFTPRTSLKFLTPRSPDMNYGYRVGPAPWDQDIDADTFDDNLSRNQCIFMNYYKLKYRWFFIKDLEAAAEPKNLQARRDNDHSGKVSTQDGESVNVDTPDVFGQESAPCKPWDPVDFVLDYILMHSDAKVAFAGTEDITTLCGSHVPDDIPAYLERARPYIEVDDNGVGSISFETSILHPINTNVTGSVNSSVPRDNAREADRHAPQDYAACLPQSGAYREWERRAAVDGFAMGRHVEGARVIACA